MPNENSTRELDDSGSQLFFSPCERQISTHRGARLHQLVLRIQPSRISLWYLLVHLGVFNRQLGEKTEISLP